VIEDFLRPRHRHYQIDTDPDHPPLGHLTTRAWEAVQHALNGNEAAAQMIFDEIGETLKELDRLTFPGEEAAQRRLKLANDRISSLNNVVEGLNARISSLLASRSWQITAPLRVLQRWILRR
jgi:hypothetical protein